MSWSSPVMRGPLVAESMARQIVADRRLAQDAACGRAFSACQRWWRRCGAVHGPATGPRALHESATVPLLGLLGYRRLAHTEAARTDRVEGAAHAGPRTRVAVLTTPWGAHLDLAWRAAATLGARAEARWCLAFNGTSLRLIDGARPFAGRHVELDLGAAARNETSFGLLWLLARAAALSGAGSASGCELDDLVARSLSRSALVCSALDSGVREAYDRLAGALASAAPRGGRHQGPPLQQQALTVVFRLLFLLYAESRGLAPLHHAIYRDAYAIGALRDAAVGRTSRGLWPALRASMRLAHEGCRIRGLHVTAFNGRLFSPEHAPLVERAHVDDATVRQVMRAIGTRRSAAGRTEPVSFAELGVEQLGTIYERLMDVAPREASIHAEPRPSPDSQRRATGSFYTPRALTDFLVRRTLAPLVDQRRPEDLLRLRVLDPAMGSGAFLVSACRYLAAAYEQALVEHGACRPGDLTHVDRAGFRRLVAQRCLYGVDLNPMAVQLARLSLWLATLARDRPLTFLDHRLRTGDSLVGAGATDIARQPPGRGSRRGRPAALPLLAGLDMEAPMRASIATRQRLATIPDNEPAVVREKERSLRALEDDRGPLARWRRAADAWCGAWFWPGPGSPGSSVFNDLVVSALGGTPALKPAQRDAIADTVRDVAKTLRFFHWSLEFPEVFAGQDGTPRADAGFDAIIGNPPWDMLRAEDGVSAAAVRRLFAFVRESGIYTAGDGHVNRFHLFVERALDLLRDGGRLGFITPWGLLADAGASAIRRRWLERAAVDAAVVFDNRCAIFPIHRSVQFLVATSTRGTATRAIPVRPAETDAGALDSIGDRGAPPEEFPVVMTRHALDRLAPRDLACPAVRNAGDLCRLLRLAGAFPAVADPSGWGVCFGRELNATEDRHRFVPGTAGLPVVEGKHVSPFAVDLAAVRQALPLRAALGLRCASAVRSPRVAYRDIASPGNRLTLIAAVLPAGVVSTHTLHVAKVVLDADARDVLCALLNSLVANWFVRHWVTTHVTAALVQRLPMPRPTTDSNVFRRLAALARRCGGEGLDTDAYVDLQAECAGLYGLEPREFSDLVESFPLLDEAIRRRIVARHTEVHGGRR